MGFKLNKTLILIVTLSSIFLSTNAVPSTFVLHIPPTSAPTTTTSTSTSTSNSNMNNLLGNLMSVPAKVEHSDTLSSEVSNFCTGTENPTLCAQTIAPYFHGSFDPVKALETEIHATMKKANEIAGVISEHLSNPSTSKTGIDALDTCKTLYGGMLDTMKEAMELVAEQNVVDAYFKFSSVIGDQDACEEAFQESRGVDMPFAQDSLDLYQLGGNCLAIMDGIVNNNKL
ncbi:uncharacterized protein LOC113873795 [Abrus precatorius]|uniref:Uncharacterized protein LOC113873795 n=1 Tax=Abrus precatorius TaxID=3816 RepID=A0A8B8MJ42_ABRPR|nr:uncharacterized protein LOC113873795 [Abrus precatorius]